MSRRDQAAAYPCIDPAVAGRSVGSRDEQRCRSRETNERVIIDLLERERERDWKERTDDRKNLTDRSFLSIRARTPEEIVADGRCQSFFTEDFSERKKECSAMVPVVSAE